MRPAPVVMDYPLCDRHLQMALVDRDQEVEALAPQASAQPFTDGVGPGRPNRSSKNSHSAVRHFLIQLLGKDGVPVLDHKTIGMIARKCLAELLQRPFRSRMSGHVVVEDTTASDLHPHEYVQVSKSGCDHDEKVTGHDDLGMVVDEGQPALFRIRRTYRATVSQVLPMVRGETRIPSFSCSSWAMRSSPQVVFSAAISRISRRISFARRGLPWVWISNPRTAAILCDANR